MELCYYLSQKGSPDKKNLKPGEQLRLNRSAKELFNNNSLKLPIHSEFTVRFGYEKDKKFTLCVDDTLITNNDNNEIKAILSDLAEHQRIVGISSTKSLNTDRADDFIIAFDCNDKKHLDSIPPNTLKRLALLTSSIYDPEKSKSILGGGICKPEEAYEIIKKEQGISLELYYLQLSFDNYTINAFRHIFLNTYISVMTGTPIDKKTAESFVIDVDTKNNTITLKDINLTEPSSEMISRFYRSRYSGGVNLMANSTPDSKSVTNYYDKDGVSGWIKYDNNNKIPGVPGIYMLFDSMKNDLYVGKANNLKDRIPQHSKTPGDPIQKFDYYRYSIVTDEEKFKELYIIENAAIHDLAMIFNMDTPNYKGMALNQTLGGQFAGLKLGDITLVNTAETQTKKNKSKK